MSTILLFIISLLVLVVGHELGHFFAAKAFGITVEEFGIGYPPRAKKLFRWKGTLFTLNWLPFGGFVKIFGEESEEANKSVEEKKKHSFSHQTLWKRLVVVVAGVAANMLLAVVLYAVSFFIGFLGTPEGFPEARTIGPVQVLITDVHPSTPASEAGLEGGDTVVSLASGGKKILPKSGMELTTFIHTHENKEVVFELVRDGENIFITSTPKKAEGATEASVGITIAEAARIQLSLKDSLIQGFRSTGREFVGIFTAIGGMVTHGLSGVAGPVGIAGIAGVAYSFGMGAFLSFMALISVNLAVINLLPFPALDGGRFILECFSKDGVSRISDTAVSWVNRTGFLLLIGIMLFVTFKDIARLVI